MTNDVKELRTKNLDLQQRLGDLLLELDKKNSALVDAEQDYNEICSELQDALLLNQQAKQELRELSDVRGNAAALARINFTLEDQVRALYRRLLWVGFVCFSMGVALGYYGK